VIAQGASPLSMDGDLKYDASRMPWCVEPMIEAVSPDVQMTVLLFAAAMAKTEIVVNIIGEKIVEEPTNIIVAYPIEDSRDKFSRDVIQRSLIEATPSVRSRVVPAKGPDSGNTISFKKFPGGSLNMIAARSPSNFRGPRAGMVYMDEIDAMPGSVGVEGDPVLLGMKRCEGFPDAVKMLSGTPTLKAHIDHNGVKIYRSRIQYWFDLGDKRKWFVPCRSCGHAQFWKWSQFDEVKDKPWNSVLLCEKCAASHNDRQRIRSVLEAEWRPTASFDGIRSYWLNGLNTVLPAEKGYRNKMHQFVMDARRAQKGMDPQFSKRVWINTFLAECDDPDGQTEAPPPWKAIYDRREDYGLIVPMKALILTVYVDVQSNRLELEWKAHAPNQESWGMLHVVLDGNPKEAQVWRTLRHELARKWQHESGAEMTLTMAMIDGGWAADFVYWFLGDLVRNPEPGVTGKVRATKGEGKHGHPIIDTKYRTVAKQLKGHHIGTWAAKDLIYERLKLEDPTKEGFMHFNKSFTEEYFQQMTSETVSIVFEKGEEIRKYVNENNARNEALDIQVGNLGAFRLRNWPYEAIKAEMEAQLQPKEETALPQYGNGPLGGGGFTNGKWW